MSSFTPGEWEADLTPEDDIEIWAISDNNSQLVSVLRIEDYADLDDRDEDGLSETMKANAGYISLVPEMVKKLEQASYLLHQASALDWTGAECSKVIADRIDNLLN